MCSITHRKLWRVELLLANRPITAPHTRARSTRSNITKIPKKELNIHTDAIRVTTQTRSALLCLPGEIRNIIYEYLYPEPAISKVCLHIRSLSARINIQLIESMLCINRLQAVCQQLRKETRHMGLTPAKVVASHSLPLPLGTIHPREFPRTFSKIVWCDSNPTCYPLFPDRRLRSWCIMFSQRNPQTQVMFLASALSSTLRFHDLVVRGLAFYLLLRGDRDPSVYYGQLLSDILPLIPWSETLCLTPGGQEYRNLPDNFRVFPCDAYDENALRNQARDNEMEFEDWIPRVREWYQVGL